MALQHPASVGILGGTFNPPHLGHLALARHALGELGLSHVALMPVHTSPHKLAAPDPGPEHRLQMCRLLVREISDVSACELEVQRGGISYTVDTLTAIHASQPDAELTFIVGADTASTLPGWREPGRLLELADLAVAARTGTTRAEVLRSVESIGAEQARGVQRTAGTRADGAGQERIRFLELPVIDVSSSQARRRVASGETVAELVGAEVARYIAEQGLYRAPGGGSR